MSKASNDFHLSLRHLLIPISLLSVTAFFLISYQTTQILRDRDMLNMAKGQQQRSFEDAQRLQEQLRNLLLGTQKLADEGNKNAKVIVDKLKEMGIQVQSSLPSDEDQTAADPSVAPVPAATENKDRGPVKP